MSDLISRSAVLKYMETTEISQYIDELNKGNDNYNSTPLYDFVKDMTTAYNIEKVVAELEKMRNEDNQGCKRVQGWKCHSYSDCGLCIMDRAIDIVRKGGVE